MANGIATCSSAEVRREAVFDWSVLGQTDALGVARYEYVVVGSSGP